MSMLINCHVNNLNKMLKYKNYPTKILKNSQHCDGINRLLCTTKDFPQHFPSGNRETRACEINYQ